MGWHVLRFSETALQADCCGFDFHLLHHFKEKCEGNSIGRVVDFQSTCCGFESRLSLQFEEMFMHA